MADLETFEKFMSWMDMKEVTFAKIKSVRIKLFESDNEECVQKNNFSSTGYQEFHAGIMYDEEGKLIKGYMDSHVTNESKNCVFIRKLIEKNFDQKEIL